MPLAKLNVFRYTAAVNVTIEQPLIPVGFDCYVAAGRIVAVANPGSLPIKRLVRQAEERGQLVDLTSGRKVKAVLVLETNHVVLIARQTATIALRANLAGARAADVPALAPPVDPEEEPDA
jgi:hypothetical protein